MKKEGRKKEENIYFENLEKWHKQIIHLQVANIAYEMKVGIERVDRRMRERRCLLVSCVEWKLEKSIFSSCVPWEFSFRNRNYMKYCIEWWREGSGNEQGQFSDSITE